MDVSLESALTGAFPGAETPGQIAGRPLEDWNAAYAKVESYFHALRIRNRVLLGRMVIHVLKRAMHRAPKEPDRPVAELAAEEMDHVVTEWFAQVLQEQPSDHMLTTRGRLALLLADMPGKWQDQFLRPGPWPEEFIKAMRQAYLRAGPDFQLSSMAPRPLDLGPIATLTTLSQVPFRKMISIWLLLAAIFVIVFLATHNLDAIRSFIVRVFG